MSSSSQIVRCILKNTEGKILLVRHKGKKVWTLPGGHIEKKEDMYQALKREILEELGVKIKLLGAKTGLKIDKVKELPQPCITYKVNYKTKKGKQEKRLEYIFLASIKANQIIRTQMEEIDEYKWLNSEEIQMIETFEQVKKVVTLV